MIRVELMKMLRRPRTWVVIALIDALPTLVAFLLALTDVGPRPGTGPAFLSAVLNNGVLFPAAALAIVLPLFLPVSVAIVSGDSIAGEAQAGTLRYLLARPAGRTRLLVAKLVTVLVFVAMAVVVVVVTGVLRRHVAVRHQPARRREHRLGLGRAADPAAGRAADPAGDGVRGVLDARRRGDGGVPVHAHRLPAGRRDGRAGVPGRVVAPAHAGRRRLDPPVPADPLLAGVRRPVPPTHPLARHRPRRRPPSRLRRRPPRRRLGQLHAPKTSSPDHRHCYHPELLDSMAVCGR